MKLNRKYCPYLITYVESTQGLMNMRDIMKQAAKYSEEGIFRMDGVVFGSDDFVADIGRSVYDRCVNGFIAYDSSIGLYCMLSSNLSCRCRQNI